MNEQPKLVFFRTDAGREPVREWIEKFDETDERTIYAVIRAVRSDWNASLRKRRVKKLAEALWEIRCRISKRRTARLIFTRDGNEMILLEGFIKKSQKTPRKNLKLAQKRKDEWKSRWK